jgi:hypothetical protein
LDRDDMSGKTRVGNAAAAQGEPAMSKIEDYTLISGAAGGAEAAFGAAAERWKIPEINYTFEGHQDKRTRGLRVLTPNELKKGDVSLSYVGKLMDRTYKNTPLFRKVLQSIWFQVNASAELFVIGWILPNSHVKGGTGWGAEFAKLCRKRLHVFDQDKNKWFAWDDDKWVPKATPVIEAKTFCGTGTRLLSDDGREAIDRLFERSFGS